MDNQKRSSFTGKIGFVLAAAGSAVGLGNLWRFPYLAAKYGGGIFLLVYIILAVTFGFTLMCAEISIGRKTGLSAIGAYKKLNSKFSIVGYLGALVPIIILPYYSVIGGWVTKYFAAYVSGAGKAAADATYFGNFIGGTTEPIVWFLIYLGATALIVLMGVEKGIEKVSKIMMPVLVVLSIVIAVYSCTMDGAFEGVKYYFTPDFSKFGIKTVVAAMGQLFYSMSLAMGIMITYGSYMKKDVSIEGAVKQIEVFDTGIAFLAGLMIIPAIFAGAPNTEVLNENLARSGPGLMFEVLPQIFDKMPLGNVFGAAFFLLVLFAALTSSISLMETVVSIICDKFKIGRKLCCLVVFIGSILIGLPSALGYGALGGVKLIGMQFLDFFDFISNSVIMPIVALVTCIFIGYIIKPKAVIEEIETGNIKFKKKGLFTVMIKYIAPVCLVLILLSSIMDVIAKMTELESLKWFIL